MNCILFIADIPEVQIELYKKPPTARNVYTRYQIRIWFTC